MNKQEWEKVCNLAKNVIEKLKTYTATWRFPGDDKTCTNTLLSLKIIDISPNDQTISFSFTTQGIHQGWESCKGQPYKYNCSSGYNQEDSTFDDVTKTFFNRLVWEKREL